MHPAGGGVRGYAPDVEIQARELLRMQTRIHEILSNHTGQSVEKISHDFDRDYFMNAEGGVEYGIIDEILTRSDEEEDG
jgi:ATP-dependent Clp protease protease subunit